MRNRRDDMHDEAVRLQEAVNGVYDAHDAPQRSRIRIAGDPRTGDYTALSRAKIVADSHYFHNGDWTLGSCDGELFHLDWVLYDIEHSAPRPTLIGRIRSRLRDAAEADREGVAG